MYSEYSVCREILNSGKEVTPLKLIKLAYISHGFHLGYLGKPIFNDEVEAWRYGPVIRSIYHSVHHFKRSPITPNLFNHVDDDLDEDAKKIISAVMKTYDKYSGLELSTLTHQKDTPWDKIAKENGFYQTIPNSLIETYYKAIIKQNENS